ncbi:hypothetical protein J2S34_003144 [Nitrobacter winogradskyi]|uniref:Uncharacterized protein n=1 Tax=Nitrobacter winogradskyi TaxID=913 RepID=A0ACC6AN40_NITWI|nr:hypothetical protein [Nitrobacter winogradskyi]
MAVYGHHPRGKTAEHRGVTVHPDTSITASHIQSELALTSARTYAAERFAHSYNPSRRIRSNVPACHHVIIELRKMNRKVTIEH